jgi:hypothetical protein
MPNIPAYRRQSGPLLEIAQVTVKSHSGSECDHVSKVMMWQFSHSFRVNKFRQTLPLFHVSDHASLNPWMLWEGLMTFKIVATVVTVIVAAAANCGCSAVPPWVQAQNT